MRGAVMLQSRPTFRVTNKGPASFWPQLKRFLGDWSKVITVISLLSAGVTIGMTVQSFREDIKKLSEDLKERDETINKLKEEIAEIRQEINILYGWKDGFSAKGSAAERYKSDDTEAAAAPAQRAQPDKDALVLTEKPAFQRSSPESNMPQASAPTSSEMPSDRDLDNTMAKWVKGLIVPYYQLTLTKNPALQNQTHKIAVVFYVNNENALAGLSIIVPPRLAGLQKRLKEIMPYHRPPIDARGYHFDQDIYLGAGGR